MASELHLVTLATELAFVVVLAVVVQRWDRRREVQATESGPASP